MRSFILLLLHYFSLFSIVYLKQDSLFPKFPTADVGSSTNVLLYTKSENRTESMAVYIEEPLCSPTPRSIRRDVKLQRANNRTHGIKQGEQAFFDKAYLPILPTCKFYIFLEYYSLVRFFYASQGLRTIRYFSTTQHKIGTRFNS